MSDLEDLAYLLFDNEDGRARVAADLLDTLKGLDTRAALDNVGINNPPIDAAAGTDDRALASVKVTDVMVLGIANWPVGLRRSHASAEGLELRAALFSVGFLLRRAARPGARLRGSVNRYSTASILRGRGLRRPMTKPKSAPVAKLAPLRGFATSSANIL